MTDTKQTCDQAPGAPDGVADPTAAERWITIRRMQSGIDEAAKVVADCKKAFHDAKETWSVHVMELGDFIRDGSLPLFENPQSEIPNPQSAEPWRTIGLNELDDPAISPSILAKLANAGIETIGDLADKTASDAFSLTDITGIGPAAAKTVDDALEAFWGRWDKKQRCEDYFAAIEEIPASEIELPKDKSFFDYYCAAELAEATDDKPAEVDAFEHNGNLYTITAGNGNEEEHKTAEAWKLEPPDEYDGPTRNAGPHPTYHWLGYEGRIVIVKNERRVMTDQARIVLDEKG